MQIKNTQDAPQRVYSFVPIQDFSESWTDEKLYKKYGLTEDEIAFIESMVRPMEPSVESKTRTVETNTESKRSLELSYV